MRLGAYDGARVKLDAADSAAARADSDDSWKVLVTSDSTSNCNLCLCWLLQLTGALASMVGA